MADILIETPRGAIFTADGVTSQLIFFDKAFEQKGKAFNNAQKWLDNAVLRDTEQFVPMRTGALKQSGILGTVVGSGKIKYIAPYARKQYFANFAPSKAAHPQASREWFEVSKAVNGVQWFNGVKTIIKGGV